MGFPVFASGDVLNASDMNAVGLWRVATGSFSAASSFDVIGFSSDYRYYKLVYSAQRVDTVGNTIFYAQLFDGATARTTGYYASAFFSSYLGTTGVGYTTNNGSSFMAGLADSGQPGLQSFDIFGTPSFSMTGNAWDVGSARQYTLGANRFTSEAYDRIRFTGSAGTVTGTWRLYGYKES